MKHLLLAILFIFHFSNLFAQEICNNGIDDNANGLIDLNDPACACSGIGGGGGPVPSLIPNPSFETNGCCPSTYSQLNCATSWVQASDATSDYFNCGYNFGAATSLGISAPDGTGYVGAIVSPGYVEYIGSCLSSPLLAGTSYTFEMQIAASPIDGFGDPCNGGSIFFSPMNLTYYGSQNCNSLPFSGYDCPTNSGSGADWVALGSTVYTPSSTWGVVSVTFTPATNINAIIFGAPCNIPADYSNACYPYFYFDNLVLNNSTLFDPVTVAQTGGVCTGNASATATAGTTGGSWQWYFNNVAIVGQTSATINVSAVGLGAGDYTAIYTVGAQCDGATTTFVGGAGNPNITPAGPFCANAGLQNLTAATGGGTWTSSCGGCINSATGQFNPALATVGNNTITYTLGGACPAVDNETILVESAVITGTTITNMDCFGVCNGQIVINATGATQYSITGGAPFQASNTFSNLCAGNYNIMVQSATANCQATTTATIVSPTALTLPTSFVDVSCFGICDGSAIVAPQGGTSPYDYNWANGAGNLPTNTNLCAGNYSVTVTDDNGCTSTTSITVSSPVAVSISNISMTQESCSGACDGTITVTSAGATQFSIDNGVTFQASNVFNNVCSGNYDVVATDANGCQSTGTIAVTTPNPMTITAGSNSTICIGQTATVSATTSGGSGAVSIIWDNGLPNGSPNTVSPITTTTYNVFAQDANGCFTNPVAITVTVNPALQVTALSDQSICPGQNAVITANASGGNGGPYTYIWDDGAGNLLNGGTQTVSPTTTTTYIVTATDNCGTPSITDNVTITVNPTPVVTFTADNLQGCTPVSVNFTNTTNPADVGNCFWNFGDGTTSSSCNPAHVYSTPGCYNVTLTVTSPFGCAATTVVNNMICVFAFPNAEFTAGPQPTDLYETNISFINLSSGASTYLWDFGVLGTSTQTNPNSILFPDTIPGTYPVCLIATSPDNCVDTICHDIIIEDVFILYVPNSFTPDNDGINDDFFPVISGMDPESYEFLIFNRWGELIFESTQIGGAWDGKHKGLMSKEDTYVWKLIVKDPQLGKKRVFFGHVNLLR